MASFGQGRLSAAIGATIQRWVLLYPVDVDPTSQFVFCGLVGFTMVFFQEFLQCGEHHHHVCMTKKKLKLHGSGAEASSL